MKLRTVPHLIGQGFVSFWRNGVMSTAAILILICCMLVAGTFYMIVDNLNAFLDSQIDELKTVTVYVDATVSADDLSKVDGGFGELLKRGGSNVVKVEHITKDDALEQMRARAEKEKEKAKREEMMTVLSKFNSENNPLPETYYIRFSSFGGVPKLLRDLEQILIENVQTRYNIKNQADTYKSLKNLRSTATAVGIVLMMLLLAFGVLVIMNTVKLTVYARRKDIAIMRYIGATGSFVISPFIVEGTIIGFIAAALAGGLQFYLYDKVFASIIREYVNLVPAADYIFSIPLLFLGIGLFAGIVASAVSVKVHSNV